MSDSEHKTTYNIYNKRYYEAHKEELYEKAKPYKLAWRERNREALNERYKAYYQLNKEKVKQRYMEKKMPVPAL